MSVYEKLAKAQAAVAGVAKAGKNESQGYAFVKAVDVVKEGKRALLDAGLTVHLDVSPAKSPLFIDRSPKPPAVLYQVEGYLIIADPETKETIQLGVVGAGASYGDEKGIYKAITGAWKYGIRGALQIPDEKDDPEVETENDKAEAPAKPAAPKGEDRVITRGQVTMLRAKQKEAHLSDDQLHAFVRAVVGKNSTTEILMSEFDTVLEKITDKDFIELFATAKVGG